MQDPIPHEQVIRDEDEALALQGRQPSALSISGGGIRSATFAWGVIEALAHLRVLKQFDYLSTVSGGGYIGSWLTAWKHRMTGPDRNLTGDEQGTGAITQVEARLAEGEADGTEPMEVRHLRAYSNYLTPRTGLGSFDFWALLSGVLRNMILNWIVIIPILLAVLMLPRLYATAMAFPEFYFDTGHYIDFEGREITVFHELKEGHGIPGITNREFWETRQCRDGEVYADNGSASQTPMPANVIDCERMTETEWGDLFYGRGQLNGLGNSWWVAFLLPGLAVCLFAYALSSVLRFLPSVGGVRHEPRDYFVHVMVPLMTGALCMDAWSNLFFVGSDLRETPVGYYLSGVLATYVLTVLITMVRGVWLINKPVVLFLATPAITLIPAVGAWLVYNQILWQEGGQEMRWYWAQYASYSLPLVLLSICIGIMLFVGLGGSWLRETDREWLARASGAILFAAVGWLVAASAVLIAPVLLFEFAEYLGEAHVTLSSLLAGIGGVLGWFSSRQREGESSALKKVLTGIATAAFLLVLVVVLAILTNVLLEVMHWFFVFFQTNHCIDIAPVTREHSLALTLLSPAALCERFVWNDHIAIVSSSNPFILLFTATLFYLFSRIAGRIINTNTYSLQGMYRNRLTRAYLGASNAQRNPNPFTGFDGRDDVSLKDLDASEKPYHIVNLTLNQVTGERLDWQQRKASAFIASPLYCGNRHLGYRNAGEYGGPGGMSLGTAVATSGAAASPNMGYHSSPLPTFIMTLFNARLGIWLGNPADPDTWRHEGPRSAFSSLILESLGITSNRAPYVYLSDGGHFENLALYEMCRRECAYVIVSDGGCDPLTTLEDLGNAIRKVEVDMGADVEFDEGHIENIVSHRKRAALATIQYGSGRTGRLLYLKPMVLGDESPDILSYSKQSPTFPHESTSDQWFDESQTESYRHLGFTTIEEVTEGFEPGGTMAELFEYIGTHYLAEGEASA